MAYFSLLTEPLPGVRHIACPYADDARGRFAKNWHPDLLPLLGRDFLACEEFYSTSAKGVLRGMHFQLPPHAHDKIVSCVCGRVLDVVVDLRRRESTFGRYASFILDSRQPSVLVVPLGCAHGFLSLTNDSVLTYKTSTAHAPESDAGVSWDSIGFEWPIRDPILSPRDARHPPLSAFVSPF